MLSARAPPVFPLWLGLGLELAGVCDPPPVFAFDLEFAAGVDTLGEDTVGVEMAGVEEGGLEAETGASGVETGGAEEAAEAESAVLSSLTVSVGVEPTDDGTSVLRGK